MNKNIKTNSGKGALGFIFSVVLLDVIGLAILMPVQAYIVRQYSNEALMVAMIPVLYAALASSALRSETSCLGSVELCGFCSSRG